MNRTIIKQTKAYAVDGGIYLRHPSGLNILWGVPGVYGHGEGLDPHALKRVSTTTAFKKAEPARDGSHIIFSHGKVTVKIPLTDTGPDDLPDIPHPEHTAPLDSRIMGVRVAAANEDYRAIFRGVQFEPERVVGTDGFRLHALDITTPASKPIVIHAHVLDVLHKLKPKRYGFVNGGIYAEGEDWVAWAEAMEGVFPEYKRVVPTEFLEPSVKPRPGWKESLKTAIQTANDDNKRVDILAGGSIEHEAIKIEAVFTESPVVVAFNGKYLLDALEHTGEGAEIRLSGNKTPALVTSGEAWAVIVPLRV